MGVNIFVKVFTRLDPSLEITKPVLNDQLEHDSFPLLRHRIT